MNRKLTEAQFDAYLDFLRASLVTARMYCHGSHVNVAEDIVDMLHNLPVFLRGSSEDWFERWSIKGYYELFVAPMAKKYPDITIEWGRVPRDGQPRDESRFVYAVQHVDVDEDGEEDVKLLGIYSTLEEATRAKARLLVEPGFRDAPDDVRIDRYRLDEDHWPWT